MSVIVPAVLPDSKEDLDKKLTLLAAIPAVSRIQIDIVDGRFASPASWPFSAPSSPESTKDRLTELEAMLQKGEMLPHLDRIEYEIDLMCLDALRVADVWLALGASRLIFHSESIADVPQFITVARKRYGGIVSFGLALNVESDLALIESVIDEIEYGQFMGIAQIGRQGQAFDERVFEKVRAFRARHGNVPVQVDGGVSLVNAKKLFALGATDVVVGSAILNARDPAAVLAELEMLHNQL